MKNTNDFENKGMKMNRNTPKLKIALIGNQNSGKTTLFNLLTGMNAKIGNWPGVTIEKKSGYIKNTNYELVDLPGIYSLSPYSTEEEVSRKFVFDEKPDAIINIVDSTSLERSLYLTMQLLELDTKVIVALNMVDLLEKRGITINKFELEKRLGVKVVQISALKGSGISELVASISQINANNCENIFDTNIETAIRNIEFYLPQDLKHKRFIAVKIIEEDSRFKQFESNKIKSLILDIKKRYEMDLEEVIATQRYRYIDEVNSKTIKRKIARKNFSDKLDKILLNKWLAFPIFVLIMALIYYLSVGVVGKYTIEVIENFITSFKETIANSLETIGISLWLKSLVVDGIIDGVGAVLNFVPQLAILFFCISLLETTGYMSRIALLLDKVFRKIGLSGKSLIPFIVGAGCSVPGIMGSRIIENDDERKMTAILTPFIPCSAKLPIITLFSSFFFDDYSGIVSVSLYFFAIAVIIFSAIIMKKLIFKNTSSTYISELPDYKLPNIIYVLKDVFEKVFAFIKRAGSIILVCSIVIWFLLAFSFKLEFGVDIEDSILAGIGNKISWVFYPIVGENNWGIAVSTIQGLVAKEQVVSSMTIISGFASDRNVTQDMFSTNSIFGFFTAASAYAFMVFNLFSAPCFGAIGAMKKELGGNAKMLKAVTFQTMLAWIIATIVYQVGSRLESGVITAMDIVIVLAILIVVVSIIAKEKNVDECAKCPYSKSCTR